MKKQTYAEYFNFKPSAALQAMVDGLEMSEEERGFRIDMGTYGSKSPGNVCFGCAATATVRACLKEKIPASNISHHVKRAEFSGADSTDEYQFEKAMNNARLGYTLYLFQYMGIKNRKFDTAPFCLNSNSYERDIPEVKEFIKKLKAAGY
jgi:hypothetical protein